MAHAMKRETVRQFKCSVCCYEFPLSTAINCVDRRGVMQLMGGAQHVSHFFCAECVRRHAETAHYQPGVVLTGLGVTCMVGGCVGTLIMAHIEHVLDERTIRLLTLRPVMPGVNQERCVKCDFGMAILRSPNSQPIFQCDKCGSRHCRKCKHDWDSVHVGRTCEELDPELQRKRVEEELCDAVIHKCCKCAREYVKIDGCNMVKCVCGAVMCYACDKDIETDTHGNGHYACATPSKNVDAERETLRLQLLQQEVERSVPDVARELNLLR